jgi:hypothetical protein
MTKIADLLKGDFRKPIEEIVKVNNADEETVFTELTEYIATDRITREYERLFRAMADAPKTPNEGVGVWISGFFGSGKSSFAKNLGYVLANKNVLGKSASDLFTNQTGNENVANFVKFLNSSIPCEVFMFDVQVDLSVQTNTEQIAEVMYRVLLRELDYAEDYDIAELEIELERESKLDTFKSLCRQQYQEDWRRIRKGAQKFARASRLLHDLEPATYQSADTWLQSVKARPLQRLTVKELVERSFDLCARRRPGKSLAFIVDEMGQYVARSGDKLENLRAIVEQFGRVSLEKLRKREIPGPAWIIVTAQEKLQEVYNYIASGRIDLPKLQDRFKYQIDLSPADIREVATKRVLSKKPEKESVLRDLFKKKGPVLLQNCKLERTSRSADFSEEEFVQFYPYLPHFIDLSIHIMTGIRLQPNAPKHLGGSNRTIIKQAHEMLVSDRTAMADREVGAIVSLDKIYELVEGNIPSEKQKDILDIRQSFEKDKDHPGLAGRLAKAVCLLEFVRDLPRTAQNLAALLIGKVDEPAPVAAVETVLQKLKAAQFIRETDDGWKLQTAQEKNWEQEKRGYASVKRSERNEILRVMVQDIFADVKAKQYNYNNLRNFSIGLTLDGQQIPPAGQITFDLQGIDASDDFAKRRSAMAIESLQDSNKNRVHWLFPVLSETEGQIEDLHASRKMIEKYTHLAGEQSLTDLEKELLISERTNLQKLQAKLSASLRRGLELGVGFFRGLKFEAGDLDTDLGGMVRALCAKAIPDLYPKVQMGCRQLTGDEPEEILRQANLNNLSPVFYPEGQGLALVVKDGNRQVINVKAEIAQEILGYLRREHSFGNKVTGNQIADHFGGIGYGWDRDVIRLVLAVLFRAGGIEITYQGRRYRNYQEPQARTPLTNNTAFKTASFAPRESIDLKTLTAAVRNLEDMIGREVDVEESAIAEEFQKMARAEKENVLPALAQAQAYALPVTDRLREWSEALDTVFNSQPDDCVRMLAGEGKSLRQLRDDARSIRGFLTPDKLKAILEARSALEGQAAVLRSLGKDQAIQDAQSLQEILQSPELPDLFPKVPQTAHSIDTAYRKAFEHAHRQRLEEYSNAIDQVKARSEFELADQTQRDSILAPLRRRATESFELAPYATADRTTGSTLRNLEEDLSLLPSLRVGAIAQLVEAAKPQPEPTESIDVIRLSDFLPKSQALEDLTDVEIEQALDRLREKLFSLRELKRKVTWD